MPPRGPEANVRIDLGTAASMGAKSGDRGDHLTNALGFLPLRVRSQGWISSFSLLTGCSQLSQAPRSSYICDPKLPVTIYLSLLPNLYLTHFQGSISRFSSLTRCSRVL